MWKSGPQRIMAISVFGSGSMFNLKIRTGANRGAEMGAKLKQLMHFVFLHNVIVRASTHI